MRSNEEQLTRLLLSTLIWHPVDAETAEEASQIGRKWHPTIDGADLAIAATASGC